MKNLVNKNPKVIYREYMKQYDEKPRIERSTVILFVIIALAALAISFLLT